MAVSVRNTQIKPEVAKAYAASEKKEMKRVEPPIKVYYIGQGSFELDWSKDSNGRIVYFTKRAAVRNGDTTEDNIVRYSNKNPLGKIKMSHSSPMLVFSRKETNIIDALKNSPHCQKNGSKRTFGAFFRIEDPLEIEKGKSFAVETAMEASSFVLWLMNTGEWKTIADVMGIKAHDAGAKQTIFNMANTNPLEILKYGKKLADHDWEILPLFAMKAFLRKAIQYKVVEQGQGKILVFNQEKIGNDMDSAIMALMDDSNRPSAKAYLYPLIKEKLDNAISGQ